MRTRLRIVKLTVADPIPTPCLNLPVRLTVTLPKLFIRPGFATTKDELESTGDRKECQRRLSPIQIASRRNRFLRAVGVLVTEIG